MTLSAKIDESVYCHKFSRISGRKLLTLIMSVSFAIGATGTATTASLKESGAHYLELKADGEVLAFRSKDANKVDILGITPCPTQPAEFRSANLADWLADQKLADCLNKEIPDGRPVKGLGLIIKPIPRNEDGLIYPGEIQSNDFPKQALNWRSLVIGLAHGDQSPVCRSPPTGGPDSLGFMMSLVLPNVIHYIEYTLPANMRLDGASRPLCIICTAFERLPDLNSCKVSLVSKDGSASLSLMWYPKWPDPSPDWIRYDRSTRMIADEIFTARSKGDLQ